MAEFEDFLVEIGTEELPPSALENLSRAFETLVTKGLRDKGLEMGQCHRYATPRRLALLIENVSCRQPDRETVRKGPAVNAAFDADGEPTKAALGFARSCGVDFAMLGRETSEKGEWLIFNKLEKGKRAEELLSAIVQDSLDNLPIPKRMRWGNSTAEFVRPVHWVVMLFGEQVVTENVMGLTPTRNTRGHRFHHPEEIELSHPRVYEERLRAKGKVEPSFEHRRERIRTLVARAMEQEPGAEAVMTSDLVDEVTALNEWPVPVIGSFDEHFLEVPAEALIETMQKNQKYFPVVDTHGRLLPRFVTVANIESKDPRQIREGNERVIRPRFKDAAFFWEQDLKTPLETLAGKLDAVVYERKLGSIADKCERMGQIAVHVGERIGVEEETVLAASRLCKADLLTNMVGEFTSLQGIMGRYYALANGANPDVANAVMEHYLPRFAGDTLPSGGCSIALALADRIDSLVGIFAIGHRPTGVKDPYALRRAALGILRILIETPLDLDLQELLAVSAKTYDISIDASAAVDDVFDYICERMYGYYQEQEIGRDLVYAVMASGASVPANFNRRVKALVEFKKLPEAENLSAANKRIRNILKKSDSISLMDVDKRLFQHESESRLYDTLNRLGDRAEELFNAKEYEEALVCLSGLQRDIDVFFETVMVLCEDKGVRENRLALLSRIDELFRNVADFSRLN